MKSAMRSKDSARLGAIRLLLSAIKQKEVDERIEPATSIGPPQKTFRYLERGKRAVRYTCDNANCCQMRNFHPLPPVSGVEPITWKDQKKPS